MGFHFKHIPLRTTLGVKAKSGATQESTESKKERLRRVIKKLRAEGVYPSNIRIGCELGKVAGLTEKELEIKREIFEELGIVVEKKHIVL